MEIILALMILYDLLLHLIELIHGNSKKAWNKWYYWPPTKLFGKKSYNWFWTIYWAVALIFLFIALKP